MKKLGLVTRFDDEIIELDPKQVEYCNNINMVLRCFTVKKGKIAIRDQQVIYYYQDWNVFCSFIVDVWDNVEEYELQIHPRLWNYLPKGVEITKLRFRGRNLAYHFKYIRGLPIIHAHIPGRWLLIIRKKYNI